MRRLFCAVLVAFGPQESTEFSERQADTHRHRLYPSFIPVASDVYRPFLFMNRLKAIKDVVDWRLCIGCGACAAANLDPPVEVRNIEDLGIQAVTGDTRVSSSYEISYCPGRGESVRGSQPRSEKARELGPFLEIWEGSAEDQNVRYRGSSGGLLTALCLFCLKERQMGGVLHSAMNSKTPWTNETVISRTSDELLQRTASRYAPSSPCEGLSWLAQEEKPIVFVGKPCDTAAVEELRRLRAEVSEKIGLLLNFFCAGTPNTFGTKELIRDLGVDFETIDEVRYRGEGWPGCFKVRYDGNTKEKSLSYQDSWGRLTKHKPLRCHLCPDGLGRIADISCGDAWNEFRGDEKDIGRSIVIVRTQRGREMLHGAMAAGYVNLKPIGPGAVSKAQEKLLMRQRLLFGRLLAFRLFGIPVPRYKGFSLFHSWIRLPLGRQIRSVLGTIRRIVKRGWWKRRPPLTFNPDLSGGASTLSRPATTSKPD